MKRGAKKQITKGNMDPSDNESGSGDDFEEETVEHVPVEQRE